LLLAKRLIIPAVGGGGTLYGIRQARAIPAKDAWIAALARQHDMPVLSNDRHFDEVDVLERIRF
jgi:predicted nucleic acid-binding protein